MSVCSKLLDEIFKRPTGFIGEESVTSLRHFLEAFSLGAKLDRREDQMLLGFQVWIESRYGTDPGHHWTSVILLYEGGSERRAFKKAGELWDKFKFEREHSSTIAPI